MKILITKTILIITLFFTCFFAFGQEISSGNIITKEVGKYDKKGNKTGEWKVLSNGKLSIIEMYLEGEKTESKSYYENGQLMNIRKFKNGNLSGEGKAYYRDGRILKIENYKNGKKDGKWMRYHFNGQLWFTIQYDEGKAIGEWTYYHENGQLSEIGNYENDNKTGEWKYYDEQGNLIKTEKF